MEDFLGVTSLLFFVFCSIILRFARFQGRGMFFFYSLLSNIQLQDLCLKFETDWKINRLKMALYISNVAGKTSRSIRLLYSNVLCKISCS